MQLARRSAGFLLHAGEEKVRESSAELSPIELLSYADGGQEGSGAALLPITAAQGLSRLGNPPCLRFNLPSGWEALFNGA
jgi:hypothetical protein